MTNVVQPILVHDHGCQPELWLCHMNEHGTWVPLPGTGPISMPQQWHAALTNFKEHQQ